jgi:hypothetical protein
VLHLVQHLLRLRQLLLRGLLHAAQHIDLLHQEVAFSLQGIAFLAYKLEFLACCPLLRRGAAWGCCVVLHRCAFLLQCSVQHCGVEVVAHPEEFSGIDAVVSVKGEPSGLYGPLDRGPSDITGTCRIRDGELGHGWA